jgi:hypothetical protein
MLRMGFLRAALTMLGVGGCLEAWTPPVPYCTSSKRLSYWPWVRLSFLDVLEGFTGRTVDTSLGSEMIDGLDLEDREDR